MPGAWTQLHAHIVFSTKRRVELIAPEFEPRLYAFLGGIARERKCQLISGNGATDHVHLLVRFPGEVAVADLIRHLKSRSTSWVNEEKLTPKRFSWQEGYGAFAVGLETMPKVKGYIAKQKSHHARVSFVDEVKEMLKRAGMEDRLSDVIGEDCFVRPLSGGKAERALSTGSFAVLSHPWQTTAPSGRKPRCADATLRREAVPA